MYKIDKTSILSAGFILYIQLYNIQHLPIIKLIKENTFDKHKHLKLGLMDDNRS